MHRARGEPRVLAFRSITLLAAAALAQLRLNAPESPRQELGDASCLKCGTSRFP